MPNSITETLTERYNELIKDLRDIHFHAIMVSKNGTIDKRQLFLMGGKSMKNWKKKIIVSLLAVSCSVSAFAPATAEAASNLEKLLYGTAAMVFISHYYSNLDDKGGSKLLSEAQQETGVYESASADNRVQNIYDNIRSTGAVSRNYNVYVSPQEDINAFMSLGDVLCVYKGSLDAFDDDELAYVMAHEIAHGEKRHSVNGVKKSIGLITAIDIYLGDASYGEYLLGSIAANYISNAVFTEDQEKQADDLGFQYLVEAGYNPGAGAAAMQVLEDRYGGQSPTGLKAVIAPSNHPKTVDRVNKNLKWMKAYSGNHVDVKDGWVVVNGVKAFQPISVGRYTDKERTYLTAGKLDKLYHKGNVPDAVLRDNVIYCGNMAIYSLSSQENGKLYVDNLNKGIRKDRGEAVKSDFEIDKMRANIEKKAAGKQE